MSREYKDEDVIVTSDTLSKTFKSVTKDINSIEKNTIPELSKNLETLKVEVSESGSSLLIIIRGSESFERHNVTVKCKLDGTEYTGTIIDGVCVVKVKLPGEYIITNSLNDTTLNCIVGEEFIDEVYFTDFYGSINVTIPELLIGETLEAKSGEHTVEKEITSGVEILDIYFQGTWEVGIKGTEFISKQSVELQNIGDSKSCTLSTNGAAYITVTLADEIKTERISCKDGEEFTRTKAPKDGKVQFFVPKIANYTVCLEQSDLIKKEVNVEAQQEYQTTLDLTDLQVPILIVTSKPENNGKTIKVSRGDKILEKILVNEKALYIIEENGEWTITCDDIPERTRTVQITENKVYRVKYGSYIFGIRVNQKEADPKQRIEVLEDTDLYGLRPISVNTQDGTVDYGDMQGTFLFEAMNHPVLLSIDGQEEIELNPNDYSQKLVGGIAPNAEKSSNYNMFSRIDKLYTYQYISQGIEYYYISDDKVNDNYRAIGFIREDDSECDYTYLATYLGSFDNQNRLRSISSVHPRTYTTFTDFANAARKNGDGYYMEQHQQLNFFEIAFLMMFQNFNSQRSLGYGRSISGYDLENQSSKECDNTTGFANQSGPIAYDHTSGEVKFMHVENLYFNGGTTFEEGILFNNGSTYVRMKPPYITTASGGTSTYNLVDEVPKGVMTPSYIKSSIADNKLGRVPSSVGGTDSTYECDQLFTSQSNVLCGCARGIYGLFTIYAQTFDQGTYSMVARLSYLPPAK